MDGIGDEVTTTTCETGTLEDIDNVVHHDVHSGKLRPHLQGSTETDTAENTRLEKIEVGLGTFSSLKLNLFLNLGVFELYEVVVLVTPTMEIGKDLQSFLIAE